DRPDRRDGPGRPPGPPGGARDQLQGSRPRGDLCDQARSRRRVPGPGGERSEPPAQVRFTAKSDDLVAIADDPGSIGRAWLRGRLKVDASIWDILRLRKIL